MTKVNLLDSAAVLGSMMPAGANDYCPKLIGASIKTIAGNGAKLDARIHATAVALVHRAADHRDASLVPNLISAMPKSSRRKALIAWFHAYSNVIIKVDAKGVVTAGVPKVESKLYRQPDPVKAEASPFWSVDEKDTDPKAFLFGKRIAALLKAAEAHVDALSTSDKAVLADLRIIAAKVDA